MHRRKEVAEVTQQATSKNERSRPVGGLGVTNMSVSDDIGNLFQRFGGNPDRYQEVARDDEAKHAASRWPLLSALDIAHPEQVPGAGRPASAATTQAPDEAKPAPDVRSAAAAPGANPRAAASAEGGDVTHDPVTSAPLRSPLFARSHRHAMMPPPVDAARQAPSRFSPPPQAATAASDADAEAAPRQHAQPSSRTAAAGTQASTSTLRTPTAPAAEPRAANDATREASRQPDAGFFADRKQTFAPAPISGGPRTGETAPSAATGRTPMQTGTQARTQASTQPQPAPQSPASRSILSSLFAAPPAHPPEPSTHSTPPRDLTTVFARLAAAPRRDGKNPGGERS